MEKHPVKIGESLYTIPEFARTLGIKDSTGRAWVLRRKVGYVKVGGRAVRIPESEVQRILSEGYVPPREGRR
jgi:excisionase family DNA binding protein